MFFGAVTTKCETPASKSLYSHIGRCYHSLTAGINVIKFPTLLPLPTGRIALTQGDKLGVRPSPPTPVITDGPIRR